jgi:DNA-directed RNA polymerase subunit RPC12/RpoP
MKYQCLNEACGKLFMYPAKKTETPITAVYETHVCPYCGSLDIEEYTPEPTPQPQITSVVSVELAQVDSYLKMGYVVRELYAKTATLVKMEVKA